jgi:hypothetical protein
MYFAFILFFAFAFLFVACDPTDDLKLSSQRNGTGSEGDWVRLDSRWCCAPTEMTDVYLNNIARSHAAWEEARTHFTIVIDKYTDDYGTVWVDEKYTDDFGGVFLDENGINNISVVGNRKPVKSDYIIYKRVGNSYNFLLSILDETSEKMLEYTIWTAGICEKCNKVFICLENEKNINPFIGHLKTKKLFKRNTLNIFVGEADIYGSVPNNF